MREYVIRDLLDTVTLHPPAGFSLRLLDPASGAKAAADVEPASDAAPATEQDASSDPAPQADAVSTPSTSRSSSADGQQGDDASDPSAGGGSGVATSVEAAAPVLELAAVADHAPAVMVGSAADQARVAPRLVRMGIGNKSTSGHIYKPPLYIGGQACNG